MYKIIEIKRNIALAMVKLNNGKIRFMNPKLIPKDRRDQHFAERRLETMDGQA